MDEAQEVTMDLANLAHINLRPETVSDLAVIEAPPRQIGISGDTKHLERLGEWPELADVWIFNANEKQFAQIAALINPRLLYLYGVRITGLDCVKSFPRLKYFGLDWNTKVTSLAPLAEMTGLRLLSIEDVIKVRDLSPLAELADLEGLQLSGGVWNVFKPDTLEPLQHLRRLQELWMISIRVKDQSLRPIETLTELRYLQLNNKFPTEEYARLSVLLPHCKCDMFQPYSEAHDDLVMITGLRKPFLHKENDKDRIEKYVKQWKALQEQYRAEQGK